MTHRIGWKMFFVITLAYLLAAIGSVIQGWDQSVGIGHFLEWLILLALACLYVLASFGYAWRRYFLNYRFWYAVIGLSLVILVTECYGLYTDTSISSDERAFLLGGTIVIVALICRCIYLYANEIRHRKE
ncbi:hypothetical protein GCM10009092_29420 [Bowmanella denitrificans]|uniref:Uncharacterized protein n=1 Tax=Bowmanella denitrificans TaxID=366582 RepID=A0ABN0XFV9_9ALTE